MLVSRGNLISPSVLRITLFSTVLLSMVILGAALEQIKVSPRNAERMKTSLPSPLTDRELPAVEDEPPVSGAVLAKECYAHIHNFTYSAIVLHNMNESQAQKWYQGRDKETFLRLAANLTQTIMKLVEEIDQVGAMFSVYKEVPTEMYNAAATYSAGNEASSDDSSSVVPLLMLIILALVLYIGFLTYQIKTKYRNSGSGILIEDH